MGLLTETASYFEPEERETIRRAFAGSATDVRIRIGERPAILYGKREERFGSAYTGERLSQLITRMLRHSLYAWEDELGEGYFTLEGGVRVGVCGKFSIKNGKVRLIAATSLLLRAAREVKGCAKETVNEISEENRLLSAMLLSPPGMGKTTILRDAARLLGEKGWQVGVADERYEIAAKYPGGGMDLGQRCDVAEGLNKDLLIRRLIRSMAPDIVITDEIGKDEDARAVAEASRMGVAVLASAHGASLEDALSRPCLAGALQTGAFERIIILGGGIGKILRVHKRVMAEGIWRFG